MAAPSFLEYWEKVERCITTAFNDDALVKDLTRALTNLDKAGFETTMGRGLDSLRQRVAAMEKSWPNIPAELTGAFLAGSFQFDSAVFGQWFRFRFGEAGSSHYQPTPDPLRREDNNSVYSVLDEEYYERVLSEAPREDTLLLNQHLKRALCIQFGGDRPRASNNDLWINLDAWRSLRAVIYSPRDDVLNRSREFVLEHPASDIAGAIDAFDMLLRQHYLDDEGLEWLEPGAVAGRSPLPRKAAASPNPRLKRLLRVLLLTCFYTIMQRGPIRPYTAIYQLIVPIFLGGRWIGSFCGAYGRPPHSRIAGLSRLYNMLCRHLYAIECLALKQLPGGARVSVAESMVRLCTVIPGPGEPAPAEMNRWYTTIVAKLGSHQPRKDGRFVDPTLEKLASGMVSGSETMFTILERIHDRVAEVDGELKARSLFLYSGPGLGKESIAHLCHYFSKRSYEKPSLERRIKDAWKEVGQLADTWKPRLLSGERGDCLTSQFALKAAWEARRSFNYVTKNSGTLDADDFVTELFGTLDQPGILTGTSLLAGTVFLDEINTARPQVINGLLRALEAPYSVEPKGAGTSMRLHLLVVFASNVALERLRDAPYNFNPAFVDRINAEFEIPSLADRKEDIPLILNRMLQNYSTSRGQQVRFIELNGLRLLMEIPWKRNVRTIRNFVDDLMKERESRTLSDDEFKTVSFEEIIQCLARRRYL